MKVIFWQNIISPHLSFLYSSLAKECEVTVIVDSLMSAERLRQGWAIPVLEDVNIIEMQDEEHILSLVHLYKDERNVFSGISGMNKKKLQFAFKEIVRYNKVIIISEAPIQLGLSKYFKKLLYKFYFLRDYKNISHIFAIGEMGVEWFKNMGFPPCMITPFSYFIDPTKAKVAEVVEGCSNVVNYLFIGQLISRKGVDNLLRALAETNRAKWKLKVIGTGSEEAKLKGMVDELGITANVSFCGTVSNDEISLKIQESDFLILPSRFDGWGAVISEALSVGVKVICSDKCGASMLISEDNGYVLTEGNHESFVGVLNDSLHSTTYSRREIKDLFSKITENKITEFVKIVSNLT